MTQPLVTSSQTISSQATHTTRPAYKVPSTKNAVNPFTEFRKARHLSQDQLAIAARVSRGLVIRNEQAMYTNPSDKLLAYVAKAAFPVGASQKVRADFIEEFIEDYKAFQLSQRRTNFGYLSITFNITDYLANNLEMHPMEYWRLHSVNSPNLSSVTRAFCVHQGILYRWEHEANLVNTVPSQLEDALLNAGYAFKTVEQLRLAYREYKKNERNKALGRNQFFKTSRVA